MKKIIPTVVSWLARRRFNWIDAIGFSAQSVAFVAFRNLGYEFFPTLGMAILVGLPFVIISVALESMERNFNARQRKESFDELIEALDRFNKGERRD